MKSRIFHITKMKGVSGSENHLLTLLSGMDKQRFDNSLCILAEARHVPALQEYAHKLEQAGIRVEILIMSHKMFDPAVVWKLRTSLRQERVDMVHTHLIHADLYGTIAAKLAGVKLIISSRHNDDKFRNRPLVRWINRALAHWHEKIIVISEWVGSFSRDVEKIPAKKIVRIHYGLEPEPLMDQADPQYIRQQFQIPDDVPLIGTIGQLAEQKGQTYLLQAIQQILPQVPDLRVVLIGKGSLRKTLAQQAKSLGIEKHVTFAGYRTDAIKLLSGFDFFVFPSLWEGFGLVLLEAMALKKAIVASAVSAIPETVLHGKTGLLVPPKHVEKLADAMLTLLKDKDLRQTLGENGYKRLQQDFTVQKMIRTTESLYTTLLN